MNAILLSILSGLLLTAGFPKPAMFYLSWVAFVPLLYAIREQNGKAGVCARLYLRVGAFLDLPFLDIITLFITMAVFRPLFPS